jgi:hypothetical protein
MVFTNKPLIIMAFFGVLLAFSAYATEARKLISDQSDSNLSVTTKPNPFAHLNDAEREYYDKSFDYALETLKDDGVYEWRTATANGVIRAGKRFISKSKSTCRSFSESYTLGKYSGGMKGFGCKREGKDGWCKLRESSMLSCAFEPPQTVFDFIEQKAGNASEIGNRKRTETEWSFRRWWPF